MLEEGGNVQRLSEQVGWLLCGVNGKDVYQPRLDPLAKVVVLLIDVSSSWTHLGRLGDVDSSSIVLKELTVNGWCN